MKSVSFRNDILPLKEKLYRLALRITLNPAEAEDVVQETMIKVWNRRDSWETIDNMEIFCLTVCRNLALDKTRHMGNQTLSLEGEMEPSDSSHHANPEEQAIQRDRIRLVRQLIDQLLRSSVAVCSCETSRARATKILLQSLISRKNR